MIVDQVPRILTDLPGPRARAVIAADEQVTSPSLARAYSLVADHADGCVVTDVDGNRFLDFAAGIAVCATGHCHPRVVQAIRRQAGRLIHLCGTDFYYRPYTDVAARLAAIGPGPGPWKVFLANSGTEAVEGAMKLARYATGRTQFLAFTGAFHGRTFGALSLTTANSKYRKGFGPLLGGVTHVPFGHPVPAIEEDIFAHIVPPSEVAAIVVEPILGSGGYVVPPEGWIAAIRDLCDRHGILLVVDEVQSGMGRTGRMFAVEHVGVEPDVVVIAKGIASGMPLGAVLARGSVMTWPPGAHGSTLGGNPVSCAAALETIALLQEGLVENAARMGVLMLGRLHELQRRYPSVTEVRGLGLMIGVEFATRRQAHRAALGCFSRGLIVLECGEKTIRLSPPLIVTTEQVEVGIEIMEQAIADEAAIEAGGETMT